MFFGLTSWRNCSLRSLLYCAFVFCALYFGLMEVTERVYVLVQGAPFFFILPLVALLISLISIFFLQLFVPAPMWVYFQRLVFIFVGYMVVEAHAVSLYCGHVVEVPIYLFNNTLSMHSTHLMLKGLFALFAILVFLLLYVDSVHHHWATVELPFLVGLLFWVFLLSISCFNFFLLFLIMELITLLLVICFVTYLLVFNTQGVKTVLQFFILNLVMSIFYLFGVSLFLLWSSVIGPTQLSFISFHSIMEAFLGVEYLYLPVYKSILLFWLFTFFFKLTIAPFSIWVVKIYSQLPVVFLLLLMTVYKIVYFSLFGTLFVGIVGFVPHLNFFWTEISVLFVVPSMFIGCLAYREHDLKSVLAFTTVSQMGYVLAGFITTNTAAMTSAWLFLIMYSLQITVFFIVFILLQAKYNFTHLNQLYLVKYYNKAYCFVLVSLLFSFAGLPPISGFFLKYFLFLHIYVSGFFMISILGLVSGFLMSIIYLQIVLQLLWSRPQLNDSLLFEGGKKTVQRVPTVGGAFYQARAYSRAVRILQFFVYSVTFLNCCFIVFLPAAFELSWYLTAGLFV